MRFAEPKGKPCHRFLPSGPAVDGAFIIASRPMRLGSACVQSRACLVEVSIEDAECLRK